MKTSMMVGGAHLPLIWNGDILLEHAIAGFIVLPFLCGSMWLMAIMRLALLVVFIAAPCLPPIAALPTRSGMTQHVAEAAHMYGSGGFAEVLAFRVQEVPVILPLHIFIFPRTVALMLFGASIWRGGLFRAGSGMSPYLPLAPGARIFTGGGLSVLLPTEWLPFDA
jgi:uncharacterized protein